MFVTQVLDGEKVADDSAGGTKSAKRKKKKNKNADEDATAGAQVRARSSTSYVTAFFSAYVITSCLFVCLCDCILI